MHLKKPNPIIVALDGLSLRQSLVIARKLSTTRCRFKVGDLVVEDGLKHVVPALSEYGEVVIDLKFHDIPNTVQNMCERVAKYSPWAVTIHASGGPEMLQGVAKTFEGTGIKVFVVTVLTSLSDCDCEFIYGKKAYGKTVELAEMVETFSDFGIVCSPQIIPNLKKKLIYGTSFMTPSIRSDGKSIDDQACPVTPAHALAYGSDYLVMGRQFLEAKNPLTEMKRILSQELGLA